MRIRIVKVVLVGWMLALGPLPASAGPIGAHDSTIESSVLDEALGFEYLYSVTNNTDPADGLSITGFALPFFDPIDIAISAGPNTPEFWIALFAPRTIDNWSYDPAADPGADAYSAPAAAFVEPDFVMGFFVDPEAEARAGQEVEYALALHDRRSEARELVEINVNGAIIAIQAAQNDIDTLPQNIATVRATIVILDTARISALSQVERARDLLAEREGTLADRELALDLYKTIVLLGGLIPCGTDPACVLLREARNVAQTKVDNAKTELEGELETLAGLMELLGHELQTLANLQEDLASASQRLADAQRRLALAEASLVQAMSSEDEAQAALDAAIRALQRAINAPIVSGETLGGFGFTSAWESAEMPFIVTLGDSNSTVDPGGPRTPSFPVPEPGTLALLGLGLAGMGLTRRKKV